jgi:hypothetical protein
MLDHVLDLSLHGDDEEDNEVQQQDGPEDWNIKDFKESHSSGD